MNRWVSHSSHRDRYEGTRPAVVLPSIQTPANAISATPNRLATQVVIASWSTCLSRGNRRSTYRRSTCRHLSRRLDENAAGWVIDAVPADDVVARIENVADHERHEPDQDHVSNHDEGQIRTERQPLIVVVQGDQR